MKDGTVFAVLIVAMAITICTIVVSINDYNIKELETQKVFAQSGLMQKIESNGVKIWVKP